jgi:hypothetical protein
MLNLETRGVINYGDVVSINKIYKVYITEKSTIYKTVEDDDLSLCK